MSQFTEFSGDSVERFLKHSKLKPGFVWEQVKDEIVFSSKGSLIIDKVVLEHKNTTKIECAYKQWSGSSHQIAMGLGVINLVYYNPELNRYWIIDFRIWDKKTDGKKETEHAMGLVKLAVKRGVEFEEVLFDSFYASSKMMNYIALTLQKTFVTNLPSTRSCKEDPKTKGYTQLQKLEWSEEEKKKGKILYLKDVPKSLPVKVFLITSNERRIDNLCTNKTDSSTNSDDIQEENAKRWKIEQLHREIKQTLGISKCQCRKNRSQRNHIACCFLSWIFLTKQAIKKGITVYEIKRRQLDDYMYSIMKHPHWKYEGV